MPKLRGGRPLAVLLQVNTSGEENKHGVSPADVVALARMVASECPNLVLAGLMTIGENARELVPGEPNPDFVSLAACRAAVAAALGRPPESLELSMGMSADFEQAVRNDRMGFFCLFVAHSLCLVFRHPPSHRVQISLGSTSVRVGSAIFGERTLKRPPTPPNN